VVYDLPPGPYQLPMCPFFRREDPHFFEHIALKQLGQFETVPFVCFDRAPALGGHKRRRSHNTFNAIGVEPVTEVKSTGACFLNDPNVIAFELGKGLLEGIIGWLGQGNGQHNFSVTQGRNMPGTLMWEVPAFVMNFFDRA
jgi:hypothetical protein